MKIKRQNLQDTKQQNNENPCNKNKTLCQSQQQGKLGAWNNARIEAWNIQTMKAAKDLQHLNNDLTQ